MAKIGLLFAGQGAQYPGMGRDFYDQNDAARKVYTLADRVRPGTSAQCFAGSKEELTITANTQPCMFATDLAIAEALRFNGVEAAAVAGFSLGELAALTYAGAFTPEQGFGLVQQRAALMQAAAEAHPGKMAAVLKLSFEKVDDLCKEAGVYPVNYNCPGQVSVAGEAGKMDELTALVKAAGGRAIPLPVGGGFHSPFMAEAAKNFLPVVEGADMQAPQIPVYANKTAKPYEGADPALLAAQIKSPVLWQKTMENMMESGIDLMIEVGPGKTLYGFVQRLNPDFPVYHCDTVENMNEILAAVRRNG